MKLTVAGLGYVGMANAVLLSQHHDVTAFDVDAQRVRLASVFHDGPPLAA